MDVVTLKADRYPAKRQAGDEKKTKTKNSISFIYDEEFAIITRICI